MKRLALVGIVLVCLALFFFACPRRGPEQDEGAILTTGVEEGPLIITVRATGEIRAKRAHKIRPGIRRTVEITYLVDAGTHVHKGDVLARFNTEDMEQRLADLEVRLTDNQTKLESVRTDLEIQKLDSATSLKTAEQDLAAAKMQLEKFVQGDEPMDRRKAELKVATAKSELARRQRRYAEMPGLLTEGFITEDQVEEERIAVESAQVGLETAQVELRLLKEYSLPLRRQQVNSALAKAETNLEKTKKRNATLLRNRQQALDAAKRRLEKTEFDMKQAKEQLAAFEVTAPTDGVVTYGDADRPWRSGEIMVGSRFYAGRVLMTIPEMTGMRAVVNVPEADIQHVDVGQTATITVEALGDKTFEGKVVKVADVANERSRWGGSDVREFEVEISVANGDGLRPGFSCDAEIVAETIAATLAVPVQAVFRDGEEFFVYPVGEPRRSVALGKSSMTHVQVLSGVKKNTRIYLSRPVGEEEYEGERSE